MQNWDCLVSNSMVMRWYLFEMCVHHDLFIELSYNHKGKPEALQGETWETQAVHRNLVDIQEICVDGQCGNGKLI